ncbi:uncharacterized protein [Porites lutea]|uniref:uncharacterized protein n=1 Tax=Porites lutea TaxID=51062 RepID=UPI003CC6B7D4
MASWNPFGQSYSIFPHQTASNDDDGDSWKIELPGGGFIQKPGSELNPFTDEPQMANEDFESPEEREALMVELDELLEERATKEKTLRELQDKEVTLRRDLNDLNRELDLQSTELHTLMETVCAKRTAMEKRVREKQKRVEELREEYSVVVRDERRNASYRIIANESRFLKRRISQQKEVRNSLRKQVDEIRDHKKMVKIRCKMMVSEERALWMSISERVKRMAENGHPLDVGNTMASSTSTKNKKSNEGSSSNTSNLQGANKEDTVGDASTGDETKTSSNTSSQSAATCVEITKHEARSCSEIKAEISPTKAEQSAQTNSSPSARDQTNPKGSVKEELDDTKLRGKYGIVFTVIQLVLYFLE